MDHFLMARRLVEAGVRVVTISFGRWDTHSDNFGSNRRRIPKLDMALAALVDDLHIRGLDRDVSVVVWGEFGRTPRINKKAGRDHRQPVSFALLAGGGMRTGQVIGSTDKLAAYPKTARSGSRTSSPLFTTTSASTPPPRSPTARAGYGPAR